MAGSLQKSTEIMQSMSKLIKVPEVAATMRDMSKEMMKVSEVFFYYNALFREQSGRKMLFLCQLPYCQETVCHNFKN